MKITKTQLKQIIKEEIVKVLSEAPTSQFADPEFAEEFRTQTGAFKGPGGQYSRVPLPGEAEEICDQAYRQWDKYIERSAELSAPNIIELVLENPKCDWKERLETLPNKEFYYGRKPGHPAGGKTIKDYIKDQIEKGLLRAKEATAAQYARDMAASYEMGGQHESLKKV